MLLAFVEQIGHEELLANAMTEKKGKRKAMWMSWRWKQQTSRSGRGRAESAE